MPDWRGSIVCSVSAKYRDSQIQYEAYETQTWVLGTRITPNGVYYFAAWTAAGSGKRITGIGIYWDSCGRV